MKNIFAYTVIIFFLNIHCYSQENKTKNYDLSTSIKSFKILCSLLESKDTINLKKVVLKTSYNKFNFSNLDGLQNLAKEWKSKNIKIIKSTETEEVLEIETYYIPLRFIKESDSNDWKFSNFVLKP